MTPIEARRRGWAGPLLMVASAAAWASGLILTKVTLDVSGAAPSSVLVGVLAVACLLTGARMRGAWRHGWVGLLEPGIAYQFAFAGLALTSAANASGSSGRRQHRPYPRRRDRSPSEAGGTRHRHREALRELLPRQDVTFLIAERDDVAAGYVSAVRRPHLWSGKDVLALDDLYVRSGFRRSTQMTTYGILIFDGAEELDFQGPHSVFSVSARMRDNVDTVLLVPGGDGKREVSNPCSSTGSNARPRPPNG